MQGYKSLVESVTVELRPLTVLAGANSSGKSSIIQPLLLIKQTLEASYDPGPLRIDGPNVEFTSVEQFFSRTGRQKTSVVGELTIGVHAGDEYVSTTFARGTRGRPVTVSCMRGVTRGAEFELRPEMPTEELLRQLPDSWRDVYSTVRRSDAEAVPQVRRNRCFLEVEFESPTAARAGLFPGLSFSGVIDALVRAVVHVPGLRGNPERLYPLTAVGRVFSGQFQAYVASVIAQSDDLGHQLSDDLRRLGLTWRVRAVPQSDTQVEIQVGRLPQAQQGGAWDLVNIADVGLGVSQILPILVALRVAQRGQTIFVEQPEIHLHPHAQVEMAHLMGEAVARGVRVVVETHSDLVLLALQTMVAEDRLAAEDVKLHWFTRRGDGVTVVESSGVDEAGAFGEWPEDFGDVQLRARDAYLTHAEPKLRDLASD